MVCSIGSAPPQYIRCHNNRNSGTFGPNPETAPQPLNRPPAGGLNRRVLVNLHDEVAHGVAPVPAVGEPNSAQAKGVNTQVTPLRFAPTARSARHNSPRRTTVPV